MLILIKATHLGDLLRKALTVKWVAFVSLMSWLKHILKGFHGQDPMVVVGFLGCLAMFLRCFFLTFLQSLWPTSSEDRSQDLALRCQSTDRVLSSEDVSHRDW